MNNEEIEFRISGLAYEIENLYKAKFLVNESLNYYKASPEMIKYIKPYVPSDEYRWNLIRLDIQNGSSLAIMMEEIERIKACAFNLTVTLGTEEKIHCVSCRLYAKSPPEIDYQWLLWGNVKRRSII